MTTKSNPSGTKTSPSQHDSEQDLAHLLQFADELETDESTGPMSSPTAAILNGDPRHPINFGSMVRGLETEKQVLLDQLQQQKPLVFKMPVSNQEVTFVLQEIDPDLIDVSSYNMRIQDTLNLNSLSDIFPAIKKYGQIKPGMLRPVGERFELVYGSRRLACIRLLGSKKYLALVGEVPQTDIELLSKSENFTSVISFYEKARYYEQKVKSGEYDNWQQLGAAYSISKGTLSRSKAACEIDHLFIRILPTPNSMPTKYPQIIKKLGKIDDKALFKRANSLLKEYEDDPLAYQYDAAEIVSLLTSAVTPKNRENTASDPIRHQITSIHTVTHSTSTGGKSKLEFQGFSDDDLANIIRFINSMPLAPSP